MGTNCFFLKGFRRATQKAVTLRAPTAPGPLNAGSRPCPKCM